jgi:hypothetical protein
MARRRRNPEIIAGRVNPDGSLATCSDPSLTITKGTTGVYTINLPPGFRLVGATFSGVASGLLVSGNGFPSDRAVPVSVVIANTLAASDNNWSFVLAGVQT